MATRLTSEEGQTVARFATWLLDHPEYVDVFNVLPDVGEKESMTEALTVMALSCDRLWSLLHDLLTCEFRRNASHPSSLVRGASIAVKVQARALALPEHVSFVASVIGPYVSVALEDDTLSLEVEQRNLSSDMDVSEQQAMLRSNAKAILTGIIGSGKTMPSALRALAHTYQALARTHVPSKVEQLVGGYLMLRLFCPAVMNPAAHGIVPEDTPITPTVQRNLTLLTKVLQGAANRKEFHSQPMQAFNDYIQSAADKLASFYDVLCVDPQGRDWASLMGHGDYAYDPEHNDALFAILSKYVAHGDTVVAHVEQHAHQEHVDGVVLSTSLDQFRAQLRMLNDLQDSLERRQLLYNMTMMCISWSKRMSKLVRILRSRPQLEKGVKHLLKESRLDTFVKHVSRLTDLWSLLGQKLKLRSKQWQESGQCVGDVLLALQIKDSLSPYLMEYASVFEKLAATASQSKRMVAYLSMQEEHHGGSVAEAVLEPVQQLGELYHSFVQHLIPKMGQHADYANMKAVLQLFEDMKVDEHIERAGRLNKLYRIQCHFSPASKQLCLVDSERAFIRRGHVAGSKGKCMCWLFTDLLVLGRGGNADDDDDDDASSGGGGGPTSPRQRDDDSLYKLTWSLNLNKCDMECSNEGFTASPRGSRKVYEFTCLHDPLQIPEWHGALDQVRRAGAAKEASSQRKQQQVQSSIDAWMEASSEDTPARARSSTGPRPPVSDAARPPSPVGLPRANPASTRRAVVRIRRVKAGGGVTRVPSTGAPTKAPLSPSLGRSARSVSLGRAPGAPVKGRVKRAGGKGAPRKVVAKAGAGKAVSPKPGPRKAAMPPAPVPALASDWDELPGREEAFEAGQVLVEAGDTEQVVYLVRSGCATTLEEEVDDGVVGEACVAMLPLLARGEVGQPQRIVAGPNGLVAHRIVLKELLSMDQRLALAVWRGMARAAGRCWSAALSQ